MPAEFSAQGLLDRFTAISDRLRAIEAQLELLSEKAGVPYSRPSEGAPAEVIELASSGDTLGAIRKYRELTGADLEAAKAAVASI